MHPTCTCGNDEFVVDYHTTARLMVRAGIGHRDRTRQPTKPAVDLVMGGTQPRLE
jgi:hypothetical protein